MKNQLSKPDYEFWAKSYTWNFNASALLLNNIDPHKYRAIRMSERDVPPVFEKAQQLYLFLRAVPWEKHYPEYYHRGLGIDPVAIVDVALKKSIKIPSVLYRLIHDRYQEALPRLQSDVSVADINDDTNDCNKDLPIKNRERNTYQLGVGILVRLLAKKSGKISATGKVDMSSSHLLQLMLDEAERLGLPVDGIKSFDRKITKGLAILDELKSA